MPVYAYKGFNAAGKNVAGTRDADNPRTIKQLLRRDGVFVTELREASPNHKAKSGAGTRIELRFLTERISSQELAMATRQMATLIGAGIPLVESLAALVDQIDHEYFKSVWSDVRQRVNEGAGFGDALAAYPRIFSGLYVNMVRAGESSGALDVVLERLADFTEAQAELRSKIFGTMFYPILMLMMAGVVTGILFMFVIPKISKLFESQNATLPLPTQVLILMSTVTKDYWWALGLGIILLVWGFRRYIKSERGRPHWHAFVLKAPIFGPLVRMIAVTRFSKTMATLLSSGVPVLTAFDIVKNVVQNVVLERVLDTARDCIKEGESIAAPLKRSGQFPPIVTHMIAVGEKSGQLEAMLNNISRAYDVQVDARLRALTSILEPIMIIFLGVIVAFIVFSIILPMLQLSSFA